jgi:HK97 family phage prohead protease
MNNALIAYRTICTAAAGVHVREIDNDEPSRIITGYAILFNTLSEPLWKDEDSEGREIIDPKAITQELLDKSDIKMTMFHNRQLILARSNKGKGTLSYSIDDKGVSFEFEAPHTADGDKALELVRRGDISGCSFAFATKYWDDDFVSRTYERVGDMTLITYRVNVITDIRDFTLAADPAYTDTSVEAREFTKELKAGAKPKERNVKNQLAEMRAAAKMKLM